VLRRNARIYAGNRVRGVGVVILIVVGGGRHSRTSGKDAEAVKDPGDSVVLGCKRFDWLERVRSAHKINSIWSRVTYEPGKVHDGFPKALAQLRNWSGDLCYQSSSSRNCSLPKEASQSFKRLCLAGFSISFSQGTLQPHFTIQSFIPLLGI
jgi:hypothetical protein